MSYTHRSAGLAILLAASSFNVWSDENVIDKWRLEPFWTGNVIHGESIFFLEPAPGSPAEAPLLFTPEAVLSLRHPATGASYEEGRDYVIDREARRIQRTPDSRIPFTTRQDFEPPLGASGQQYRDGARDIFFGEGRKFHDLQVEITYRHSGGEWSEMNGPVPDSAANALPGVMRKLRVADPVSITLLGDSISFGLNASGVVDAPPHQPAYGDLFAKALGARFGSPITFRNPSVSGMSAAWGIEQAPGVAAARPDLVLIAFGMNDASGRLAPDQYAAQIAQIMADIRKDHPPAEFILVATMLGNADWIHATPALYPQYRDALKTLAGPGVAIADLTSVWETLLARKTYADLTGNGVNHPNDFGHRVYAQVLLSMMLGTEPQQ